MGAAKKRKKIIIKMGSLTVFIEGGGVTCPRASGREAGRLSYCFTKSLKMAFSAGRRSILTPRAHPLGAALVGVHLGPTGGHGPPPCSKTHRAADLEDDSCSKVLAEKGGFGHFFGAVGESA